ncbi:hypothetical protein ACM39_10005 [Chryseobacterium sp. FH2]|uniref:hypothetical protein n=1 Tax=Chryseobacterium sp. FH2 TaxID=1674291 RepID=UPI00065AB037|nr:hypothetical protein [Chryseobacterium sp. FH2]KMQ68175.1 hypothetical protein ACM39_10005 [Chryseobacterium sp. FH2]
MSFYSKFSEKDLIESYNNQIDYQGKPSEELLQEISQRGSIDDFINKIENQKLVLNERNRIIREIHQHYFNKFSKQECLLLLSSDIIPHKEMETLVDVKYKDIHYRTENLKIDSNTIISSFAGAIVASIVSTIVILFLLIAINSLIVFNFFLLVPMYIINCFVI